MTTVTCTWPRPNGRAAAFDGPPSRSSTRERAGGWSAYVEGVFWALRERGHPVGGAQVLVDGNVPSGAGLSSSAALECSVAGAANALFGLGIEDQRTRGGRAVRRRTTTSVRPRAGWTSSSASSGEGGQRAALRHARPQPPRPVPFDLAAAGLALLVIDTKSPHQLVTSEYGERRASCERAAALLGVHGAAGRVGRRAPGSARPRQERRRRRRRDARQARPARGDREPAGARHGRGAAGRPLRRGRAC